jgi:hypothetical protein
MRQSLPDTAPNQIPEAEQVAAYVASLARELKTLADSQQLSALGYLLDLVRIEAEERAQEERQHANRVA